MAMERQSGGGASDDGPAASSNGGPTSHRAAADELMKLLDDELDQAHIKIDEARREADEARQNAAAAAEVARRYRTRNYRPVDGLDGGVGSAVAGDEAGAGGEVAAVEEPPLVSDEVAQHINMRMQQPTATGPNDVTSPATVDTDDDVAADAGTYNDNTDDYAEEDVVMAAESSGGDDHLEHVGKNGGLHSDSQTFAEEHVETDAGVTAGIRLNGTQDDESFYDASEHHELTSIDDNNQDGMSLEDAMAPAESTAPAVTTGAEDDSAYMEDDHEESADDADAGAGNDIATPSFDKSIPSLPAGWVETMDEASGVPYYYREVDGYTTWERPVAYAEEPQSRPDDALKATMVAESQHEEGWGTTTPGKQQQRQHVQGTPSSFAASILTPTSATCTARHDNNIRSPLSVQSVRSTASRLTRSNAEDVLAISLELETVREQVDKERSGHEQAKAELAETREEIRRLKNEREDLAVSRSTEVDGLRIELSQARHRVTAAEEDANLALDIAKGSAESREQLEGWLQRALDEIEILREQLANATAVGPGGGQVILIGSPTSTPTHKHTPQPPPPRSSRGGESCDDDQTASNTGTIDLGIGSPLTSIAEESGNTHATTPKQRPPLPPLPGNANGGDTQVMQRSKSATTTIVTVTKTTETEQYLSGAAPPPPVQTPLNTPQRESMAPPAMVAAGRAVLGRSVAPGSAQAKQQARSERLTALKEKLKTNDKILGSSTLAKVENRLVVAEGDGSSRALVDPSLVWRVALLLSESGTALALGGPRRRNGRWGLHVMTDSDGKEVDICGEGDGIDLEGLVFDYCKSVEAKMGILEGEIDDVRAFCSYVETKVVNDNVR